MTDAKKTKVTSATATLDRLKASGQLSALTRGKPVAAAPSGAQEVPLDKIRPDPDQPRRNFDQERLASLAESIRSQGVLQPITVQPANMDGVHVIIMGERRFLASRLAGLGTVPVLIKEVTPELRMAQLTENVQRDDLTTLEIARAVAAMRESGKTRNEIAVALGWSEGMVSRFATIAQMPDDLMKLAEANVAPRALADLYSIWKSDEDEARDFISETSAADINFTTVGQLRDRLAGGAGEAVVPDLSTTASPSASSGEASALKEREAKAKGVVLICKVGEDIGRIDTNTVPEAPGCLVVRFENGARTESVPLAVKLQT